LANLEATQNYIFFPPLRFKNVPSPLQTTEIITKGLDFFVLSPTDFALAPPLLSYSYLTNSQPV